MREHAVGYDIRCRIAFHGIDPVPLTSFYTSSTYYCFSRTSSAVDRRIAASEHQIC
jgi:hypothetical protein